MVFISFQLISFCYLLANISHSVLLLQGNCEKFNGQLKSILSNVYSLVVELKIFYDELNQSSAVLNSVLEHLLRDVSSRIMVCNWTLDLNVVGQELNIISILDDKTTTPNSK